MALPNVSLAPVQILVVSDGDLRVGNIVNRLMAEFGAALQLLSDPGQALAQCESFQPEVLVLGLASVEATERLALALRAPGLPGAAPAFTLALCDAASVNIAARLARQGLVDEYVQHFPEPWDTERLATSVRLACRFVIATRPPVDAAGVERPTVMVVEDDAFSRKLIALAFEQDAIDLAFESDGAAAFARIREIRPDLILMDVNLPGRDGVELTEQLKAEPSLADIPVVMLTGDARRETLLRSLGAGAADFIVKPFSRDSLVAKLGKYLPSLQATPS
ncbi:MAG: response regulator [Caldimonas sp.]